MRRKPKRVKAPGYPLNQGPAQGYGVNIGRTSNGAQNLAEDIAIGEGCTTAETHSQPRPQI
jgi:hypothetical protein